MREIFCGKKGNFLNMILSVVFFFSLSSVMCDDSLANKLRLALCRKSVSIFGNFSLGTADLFSVKYNFCFFIESESV